MGPIGKITANCGLFSEAVLVFTFPVSFDLDLRTVSECFISMHKCNFTSPCK